ncbi:MAG: jacalin-like lectin [Cyanobacteria bacterium P01_D01_bin.156]
MPAISFSSSLTYGEGSVDPGIVFDDSPQYDLSNWGMIQQIIVYSGENHFPSKDLIVQGIIGIKVLYENGHSVVHGTQTGKTDYVLLEEDEYISQIAGTSGWIIDQLSFTTNQGRVFGPYGGGGGEPFTYDIEGKVLVAFAGRKSQSVNDIRSIRFISMAASNLRPYLYSRTYGKGGSDRGEVFDNYAEYSPSVQGKIKQITVFSGEDVFIAGDDVHEGIYGVRIAYSSGPVITHGQEKGTAHRLDLATDEFVVQVSGRSGWAIDQLSFVTNKGNVLGPCGGNGGSPFRAYLQGNALAALAGQEGESIKVIRSIRFATIAPSEFLAEQPGNADDSSPSREAKTATVVSLQQTFVQSKTEATPADSGLYISEFHTENDDKTENHIITGVHITLSPQHPNQLWGKLHIDRQSNTADPNNGSYRPTTKSLTICCDTLEIGGEFCLPEADVTIYARRLVWATDDAAINTMPLRWSISKAKGAGEPGQDRSGADGVDGRHAGNLAIYVSEVAEPSNPRNLRKRLIANGGRGQDPGAGKDGEKGEDVDSKTSFDTSHKSWGDPGPSTSTGNFDLPAVRYTVKWDVKFAKDGHQAWGEGRFPEDGHPASPPGRPGNGGNAGKLTTNLYSLIGSLQNAGGRAGIQERTYIGGSAGQPSHCGIYHIEVKYRYLSPVEPRSVDLRQEHRTYKGNDAPAPAATRGDGHFSTPSIISVSNPWLHPLSLQKILDYARDLYLAENRETLAGLLNIYATALIAEMPNVGDVWTDDAAKGQWNAVRQEMTGMLQRLRLNLDYFGNPGGFMPQFSLAAEATQYKNEISRSLRMLLLVRWIEDQQTRATKAAEAFEKAIETANEDIERAADNVVDARRKIAELNSRISFLKSQLEVLSHRLASLQKQLMEEARDNLERQRKIQFGINIATTICQVFPVGQPALGSIVGSLGGVASNLAENDSLAAPDTLAAIGAVFETVDEVRSAAQETTEDDSDPQVLSQIGAGMGPALLGVSEGLQALQVPQSEVEAELQKLIAESEAWQTLVQDIRTLNEHKTKFAEDLAKTCSALSDSYAQISTNATAVLSMQKGRTDQLDYVSPEMLGRIQQMGQRSRMALVNRLYTMVKAYETTVFQPLTRVDWKLTDVTEEISRLLQGQSEFNPEDFEAHTQALEPIFDEILQDIRSKLREDFNINRRTQVFEVEFTPSQTPGIINTINRTGKASFNPMDILFQTLSDYQLMRLSDIEILSLTLGEGSPTLHNFETITIRLSRNGIVRREEHLYAVYSEQPLSWSWSYIGDSADIQWRENDRSVSNQDNANLIIGDGGSDIKQKFALPPAWSDMELELKEYSEAKQLNPDMENLKIETIKLALSFDVTDASDYQKVIKISPSDGISGTVINCSPDLADRRGFLSDGFRIYSAGKTITISVPKESKAAESEEWNANPALRRGIQKLDDNALKSHEITFNVNHHIDLEYSWEPVSEFVDSIDSLPHYTYRKPGEEEQKTPMALVAEALVVSYEQPTKSAAEIGVKILQKPMDGSAVLATLSSLEKADIKKEIDGWRWVNYRGLIGWVKLGSPL